MKNLQRCIPAKRVALLVLLASLVLSASSNAADQPNILFIFSDVSVMPKEWQQKMRKAP